MRRISGCAIKVPWTPIKTGNEIMALVSTPWGRVQQNPRRAKTSENQRRNRSCYADTLNENKVVAEVMLSGGRWIEEQQGG